LLKRFWDSHQILGIACSDIVRILRIAEMLQKYFSLSIIDGNFLALWHLKLLKISWKLDYYSFASIRSLQQLIINFLRVFKDPANQKIRFLCLCPDWLNFKLIINLCKTVNYCSFPPVNFHKLESIPLDWVWVLDRFRFVVWSVRRHLEIF
jgi:hypothetical protein